MIENQSPADADGLVIEYLKNTTQFVPIVASWLYNEWGVDYPDMDLSQWQTGVESRLHSGSIPLTLVALETGEAVGTASIYVDDMDGYKSLSPWLAAVFVRQDRRRRGIGSALVRRIQQIAGDMAIDRLYLFTPDQEHFYKELGWVLLEKATFREKSVSVMGCTASCQPDAFRDQS